MHAEPAAGDALVGLAGSVVGWCLYALRWRRAVSRANVERHAAYLGCRSARAIHGLVRRSYAHLGHVLASLVAQLYSELGSDEVLVLPARLLAQLEHGPAIICTGHIGLWELVPHIVARALSPGARSRSVIVYRPLHNRMFDRLVLGWRRRCGIELLPARGSWPRLVEALRAGGLVGLVADQRPHGERARRSFLGERVPFDDGIGRLHALTGAPTWFVAVVRDGSVWRSHWVELSDSRRLPAEEREDASDGDAVMDRYAHALSECVRRWPEQYLWAHRRWRHA